MKVKGRLTWKSNQIGSDAKSEEWLAFNDKKEYIGLLEYEHCGQFLHWIWYQVQGVGMSAGCLDDVRAKQKELYALKRN